MNRVFVFLGNYLQIIQDSPPLIPFAYPVLSESREGLRPGRGLC